LLEQIGADDDFIVVCPNQNNRRPKMNRSLTRYVGVLPFLLLLASPLTAWSQTGAFPFASVASPGPCGGNPDDYVVGVAEDFNGPVDTTIWLDRSWFSPLTLGYQISNGSLKLWLRRDETDPTRKFVEQILHTGPITPVGGNPARTGYLQRYGCFEMEARLPFGKGLFPAFWLVAVPELPEIDIMEAYMRDDYADAQRHPISYEVTMHIACTSTDPECTPTSRARAIDQKLTYPNQDLSAGFHRYAAKWEPDQITFYLDGNAVHTTVVHFADPMYISVGIGPDPRGLPDDTTPTLRGNVFDPGAIYEINYIRSWCFKSLGCR
jgi:hypothetical protein